MIVVAVIAILTGILTTAAVQANIIFQIADITADLQNRTRIAIENMLFDLRMVTNDTGSPNRIVIFQNDPPGSGSDSIQYCLPDPPNPVAITWSNPISIRLDNNTRQLIRNDGIRQKVLANSVQRVNFIDDSIDVTLYADELNVILTLDRSDHKGRAYTVTTFATVNMRN